MRFGSLFTGGLVPHGGGFDIGFIRAGMIPIWECEITRGSDVKTLDTKTLGPVDLVCGGPPCTKTSGASRLSGTRSGESLWSEMLRVVAEVSPKWVVVEQPASAEKSWVLGVVRDLERNRYGVTGRIVDSKHWVPQQRARWFIVARMGAVGLDLGDCLYSDSDGVEIQLGKGRTVGRFAGVCPDCLPGGIFARVYARKPSLIAAGNAVSVPVAEWIGRRIMAVESKTKQPQAGGKVEDDIRL